MQWLENILPNLTGVDKKHTGQKKTLSTCRKHERFSCDCICKWKYLFPLTVQNHSQPTPKEMPKTTRTNNLPIADISVTLNNEAELVVPRRVGFFRGNLCEI